MQERRWGLESHPVSWMPAAVTSFWIPLLVSYFRRDGGYGLTTAIDVVDIETSGLSYERHQILQVGVWLANLSSGRVTLYELNALTPRGRTVPQRPTK